MEALLGDISRILRSTGRGGEAFADCLGQRWEDPPPAGTPAAQLVDEEATWTVLLSGEILATAACELALALIALRQHRLAESGFLCHVAKVLVDTSADPSLAAIRSDLGAQILQTEQARRALVVPGNHAVDRGAVEEAIALYEHALEALPDDALLVYELARTRSLGGLIGPEEYGRQLGPVLAANPFFEQAMGQVSAEYASAFRTRLRPWAHHDRAGIVELCDFAAGALDAGLGWWAAMAYVSAAHLDLTLSDRLPQALTAAAVPSWVASTAPLSVTATALHDLLEPLRWHTRRVLRHLECGQVFSAPPFLSTREAARRALREAPGSGGWASLVEGAASVADSADALVGGDLQHASALAEHALGTTPVCAIERAHALEVQAAVLSGQAHGLTRATGLLAEAAEAHTLSSSEVGDQARVLTRLAAHHRALGRPDEARLDLTRSLGLLISSGRPDRRLLVLGRYLLASSLAELGEVQQAARAYAEGQALGNALTIEDIVSSDLIVGVDGRLRLLDDLRFREMEAHVDLVRIDRDAPALLRALRVWRQSAVEMGRPQSDLDTIGRKISLVELEVEKRRGG